MSELFLGVMSGTSLDGIDIALCEITQEDCRLVAACEYPFSQELKERILRIISSGGEIEEIVSLDTALARMYAEAIGRFLADNSQKKESIAAIGLHGQTLWHAPKNANSLQLGNAHIVAATTDIRVVADFRRMDMALGGEGAPLTPAFHRYLFGDAKTKRALVNIGGIANMTVLGEKLVGYDVGVGNMLLDEHIRRHKGLAYDDDGAWAKKGSVCGVLLGRMLDDAYMKRAAPKSCGREYFNMQWLQRYCNDLALDAVDIQATLTEFVALGIAQEAKCHDIEELIVCGGGAKNGFLLERIRHHSAMEVLPSDALGISGDFLEAMAFAYFAAKRIWGESLDLRSVTGAKRAALYGVIYE